MLNKAQYKIQKAFWKACYLDIKEKLPKEEANTSPHLVINNNKIAEALAMESEGFSQQEVNIALEPLQGKYDNLNADLVYTAYMSMRREVVKMRNDEKDIIEANNLAKRDYETFKEQDHER